MEWTFIKWTFKKLTFMKWTFMEWIFVEWTFMEWTIMKFKVILMMFQTIAVRIQIAMKSPPLLLQIGERTKEPIIT